MKSRLIWIIALALLLCCALGTGQAETGAAGGIFVLPGSLTAIGDEAFLDVPARTFDIPDTVASIGSNPFPGDATLLVVSGSYAETWAREHGCRYTVK